MHCLFHSSLTLITTATLQARKWRRHLEIDRQTKKNQHLSRQTLRRDLNLKDTVTRLPIHLDKSYGHLRWSPNTASQWATQREDGRGQTNKEDRQLGVGQLPVKAISRCGFSHQREIPQSSQPTCHLGWRGMRRERGWQLVESWSHLPAGKFLQRAVFSTGFIYTCNQTNSIKLAHHQPRKAQQLERVE